MSSNRLDATTAFIGEGSTSGSSRSLAQSNVGSAVPACSSPSSSNANSSPARQLSSGGVVSVPVAAALPYPSRSRIQSSAASSSVSGSSVAAAAAALACTASALLTPVSSSQSNDGSSVGSLMSSPAFSQSKASSPDCGSNQSDIGSGVSCGIASCQSTFWSAALDVPGSSSPAVGTVSGVPPCSASISRFNISSSRLSSVIQSCVLRADGAAASACWGTAGVGASAASSSESSTS